MMAKAKDLIMYYSEQGVIFYCECISEHMYVLCAAYAFAISITL